MMSADQGLVWSCHYFAQTCGLENSSVFLPLYHQPDSYESKEGAWPKGVCCKIERVELLSSEVIGGKQNLKASISRRLFNPIWHVRTLQTHWKRDVCPASPPEHCHHICNVVFTHHALKLALSASNTHKMLRKRVQYTKCTEAIGLVKCFA